MPRTNDFILGFVSVIDISGRLLQSRLDAIEREADAKYADASTTITRNLHEGLRGIEHQERMDFDRIVRPLRREIVDLTENYSHVSLAPPRGRSVNPRPTSSGGCFALAAVIAIAVLVLIVGQALAPELLDTLGRILGLHP